MADRIDKVMVERGMVKTRSQASMLICQGDVTCNGKVVTKTGLKVGETDNIEIQHDHLYVSRGAFKLKRALIDFNINLNGKVVADIGASTGGFTQVCLEAGASRVYSIDVGHDQLSPMLRDDKRVFNMEGTNIKFPVSLPEKVDIAVIDISFISITKVFDNVADLLKENGKVIALIKPQFEAGKERIGKNGLINDEVRDTVLFEIRNWFSSHHYKVVEEVISPIVGNKSGNVEFLFLIEKSII